MNNSQGRLAERSLKSIQEEAKTFLVFFYNYADDTQKKCMQELLTQSLDDDGGDDENGCVEEQVNAMVEKFDHLSDDEERMKDHMNYERWARRLCCLHRISCAYNSSALQKLRTGEDMLRNTPPETCWTSQDDYDLVIGTFKHGLGQNEAIRSDKEFGFHDRYKRQDDMGNE